jgi:D-beta-D-heptose 7-phosphate kinase / D-beta-D-heptose 1-phosphate adenosyltransferase
MPAYEEAAALAARHRTEGQRIVLTGGCFDLLHVGHVRYLQVAKELGDVLIVALNSDDSVRQLKGPGRPLNDADARAEVLAALSCVDHVVVFGESTPDAIIRAVRPDVYVKGGDYTWRSLPEATTVAELGGEVRLVAHVKDHSTSALIARILHNGDSPEKRAARRG